MRKYVEAYIGNGIRFKPKFNEGEEDTRAGMVECHPITIACLWRRVAEWAESGWYFLLDDMVLRGDDENKLQGIVI